MNTPNTLSLYTAACMDEIATSEKKRPIQCRLLCDVSTSTSRFVGNLCGGVRSAIDDIKDATDDAASMFMEVNVFSSGYGETVRTAMSFQSLLDVNVSDMPDFVAGGGTPGLAAICDQLEKYLAVAKALKAEGKRTKGVIVVFGDGEVDDVHLTGDVLNLIAEIEALETAPLDRLFIGMNSTTVNADQKDSNVIKRVQAFDQAMEALCTSIGFTYLSAGTRVSAVTALIRKSVVATGGQMADEAKTDANASGSGEADFTIN